MKIFGAPMLKALPAVTRLTVYRGLLVSFEHWGFPLVLKHYTLGVLGLPVGREFIDILV